MDPADSRAQGRNHCGSVLRSGGRRYTRLLDARRYVHRGIVYQEVFGPDPGQCASSMQELETAVLPLRRLATSQLEIGVSPHAPYTVSAPLYEAVAAFARLERLPLAVHVAESQAESKLVCDGAGPFGDALRARGIVIEPRRCSPVAYLVRLGVIQRGTLCIHCVQIDAADIRLLREAGAAVAHCPRSNTAHRHGSAPLQLLLKSGVPLGLGTDSVISVGDLDLWKEAEAAASLRFLPRACAQDADVTRGVAARLARHRNRRP